jgi:hypothetical protein
MNGMRNIVLVQLPRGEEAWKLSILLIACVLLTWTYVALSLSAA